MGMERERPFLPHVIRHSSLWPDDQHQPLADGDRILYSLVKRQPARRHGNPIPPNVKPALRLPLPFRPGESAKQILSH